MMSVPPDPSAESVETKVASNAEYELKTSKGGHAAVSALVSSNDVRIKDSTLSMTVTSHVHPASKLPLDVLYERVAPHAILNKGGRVDDAKCHAGTRQEVIGLIEKWMDDATSDRIFWMSGPAGGGKTAIMKTVAERSADRSTRTINFFFSRGDSSRNSAQTLIPTLLYQLFQLYPSFLAVATKILSECPRILDDSLEEQYRLISALFPIIQESSPTRAQIILLIDGLDECEVEADRAQADILHMFERLVTQTDSPFRLLVSSRPDPRIQMTFNQLLPHVHSIFLSKEYHPENDIRTFVRAEFDKIKASHPSRPSLPAAWPSTSDMEAIIAKSSGQFIYAATVMRYISDPSTVPTLNLERVMGLTPTGNNSPFRNLDSIYNFILDQTCDREATRDMLSINLLRHEGLLILRYYDSRYSRALLESCALQLLSIVRLAEDGRLESYHASLTDFLTDKSRAGSYYIDIHAFRARLLVALWRKYTADDTFLRDLLWTTFADLRQPSLDITHMLLKESAPYWMISQPNGDFHVSCLQAIRRMYYDKNNIKTYRRVLRRVISMAVAWNARVEHRLDPIIPYAEEYHRFYQKWNWWFRLSQTIDRKKR